MAAIVATAFLGGAVTGGFSSFISKAAKSNTEQPAAPPASITDPNKSSVDSASQTNGTSGSTNPAARILAAQNNKGFASNSQNTARSFLLSL